MMIVLYRWITARHRTEIEEQGRKTRTLDRFRWRQIRSTTHPRYQTGFKSSATLRPHSRLLGSVRPTGIICHSIIIPTFLVFKIQRFHRRFKGSRWTFQATRMDGTLGATTIKPDQLQIVNPLLILALVPVFESVIYPCFKKCGLLTPLQRIGAGGLLAGLAFVISGIVELQLEVRKIQ